MRWTTKQFAMVTGVSVRTLHYYDEIGLLKPAYTDKQNGYRFYDGNSYGTMKEILFYREFDFTLEQISELLSTPEQERRTVLMEQREKLMAKKARLEQLIALADGIEQGDKLDRIVDSFISETAQLDSEIISFYDLLDESDRILENDTVHEGIVLVKTVRGNIYHMFQSFSVYEPMRDIAFMDMLAQRDDARIKCLVVLCNPGANTILPQNTDKPYHPEMPGWGLRCGLLDLAPENKDTLLLLSAGEIFNIRTLESVQPMQTQEQRERERERLRALRESTP